MIDIQILYDEKKKRQLRITQNANCELQNPKNYFFYISFNMIVFRYIDTLIEAQKLKFIPTDLKEIEEERLFEFIKRQSVKEAEKESASIDSQSLPDKVFDIFTTDKKDIHKNALKNYCFTMDKLLSFYFKSFERYGCLYSKYLFIIKNEGIDESQMPEGAMIEKDGSVTKFGYTSLKDGQIRQAIDHRKSRRADILDRDEKWYCFYWTWKSIDGKESSKKFDEHIHYIDYTWGLTREHVLNELNSKDYKLNGIHINFEKNIYDK